MNGGPVHWRGIRLPHTHGRTPSFCIGLRYNHSSDQPSSDAGLPQTIGKMLDNFWAKHIGDLPPIAHSLRVAHGDRWVRFHSLPDSKRYADSDQEWSLLLERHNEVLGTLVADGTELQLLTTRWSESERPESPHAEICKLQMPAEHWRTVPMHEIHGDPEPHYWHVFRSSVEWASGSLDQLIRLVADDRIRNVMILDASDSWLFHPYDGGMDVILRTSAERDEFANQYKQWRSKRSDGL